MVLVTVRKGARLRTAPAVVMKSSSSMPACA
jgi:hypothetical protein